jgi:hypothetical protein
MRLNLCRHKRNLIIFNILAYPAGYLCVTEAKYIYPIFIRNCNASSTKVFELDEMSVIGGDDIVSNPSTMDRKSDIDIDSPREFDSSKREGPRPLYMPIDLERPGQNFENRHCMIMGNQSALHKVKSCGLFA